MWFCGSSKDYAHQEVGCLKYGILTFWGTASNHCGAGRYASARVLQSMCCFIRAALDICAASTLEYTADCSMPSQLPVVTSAHVRVGRDIDALRSVVRNITIQMPGREISLDCVRVRVIADVRERSGKFARCASCRTAVQTTRTEQ